MMKDSTAMVLPALTFGDGDSDRVEEAAICEEAFDPMLDIIEELMRARKTAKFASPHEGFAFLSEKVDELWAAVKTRGPDTSINVVRMRRRATQDRSAA